MSKATHSFVTTSRVISSRTISVFVASCIVVTAVPPLPLLSSCGGFHVDPLTQRFIDGCGRERWFKGMNKVEKSPPYVPDAVHFSAGNSLTDGDAALMQSLGFNAMRLGAMWAGAAPTRDGGFNSTYITQLTDISTTFADDFGINTLVDAHQDLLSEAFCADGAPPWLAHDMANGVKNPFPLPLAATPCPYGPDGRPANMSECCNLPWSDYYVSSAVSYAFQQLYTNATFYNAFSAFWSTLALAYAPLSRGLIGFELLNEPWAGDVLADPTLLIPGIADRMNLEPFYKHVVAAIRNVTPTVGVIFYEGVTWDDFFPLGFDSLSDADAGLAAISYHYYDLPGLDFELDIIQRAADMVRLHAGAILTEFAIYPDGNCPNDLKCMRRTLDLLESHAHSYIGWEYASMWNGSVVAEAPAYELARPSPLVVGGVLEAYAFDRASSTFTINFTVTPNAPLNASSTVIFASLGFYFPTGYSAVITTQPNDAVTTLEYPCWAGVASDGVTPVNPPNMQCSPSTVSPTPGAPPAYAFGYVALTLTSVIGGHVSLIMKGLPVNTNSPSLPLPSSALTITTIVGAPIVFGGPVQNLFDSPYLALKSNRGHVGLTANGETVVFGEGDTIFSTLPVPLQTGLKENTSKLSYSHCGKWLNAAYVDSNNASVVHGFFHQEWQCNYTNGGYTNKSVGYARSEDGGLTFTPWDEQIIAGLNTTTVHQTGQGDHGVVRLGSYLYMLFLDWNAPNGLSVGLARAPVASGGVPGSWIKYFNQSFEQNEPGVGGLADRVNGFPAGTAIARVLRVASTGTGTIDAFATVGVQFSSSLNIAWSTSNIETEEDIPSSFTTAVAGPLFTIDSGSWKRNINSSELFAYPSLVSDLGSQDSSIDPSLPTSIVFTYLAPRDSFNSRWIIRRPLNFFTRPIDASPSSPLPPALETLSIWRNKDANIWWATTGPVTNITPGMFTLFTADIALILTSADDVYDANKLVECEFNDGTTNAPQGGRIAITNAAECGNSGVFINGKSLRTLGWITSNADTLGWARVAYAGSNGIASMGASSGQLWRCIGIGEWNYTVSFNDEQCISAGTGFKSDALLGYALSQLAPLMS